MIKNLAHFDLMTFKKRNFEFCLLTIMENSTCKNQSYYIWVYWKNGKGADDIHKEFVTDKAPSKCAIYH